MVAAAWVFFYMRLLSQIGMSWHHQHNICVWNHSSICQNTFFFPEKRLDLKIICASHFVSHPWRAFTTVRTQIWHNLMKRIIRLTSVSLSDFFFPPHTPIAEEFKMKNTDNMCTYGAFAAFLPDTLFSYSHKNVKISYWSGSLSSMANRPLHTTRARRPYVLHKALISLPFAIRALLEKFLSLTNLKGMWHLWASGTVCSEQGATSLLWTRRHVWQRGVGHSTAPRLVWSWGSKAHHSFWYRLTQNQ